MDQTKKDAAARRMTDARTVLVNENPFFGHLAMSLKLACAPCGTACTDGSRLIFDPDFAGILSDREMQFVVLHEVLHCVLEHCIRGKGLHSAVHNIACDIVVNSTILQMWGIDSFRVGGEPVMHLAPDGREGREYNSEEVYAMLLDQYTSDELDAMASLLVLDTHDLWQAVRDKQRIGDEWDHRIRRAASLCGDTADMPQSIREIAERLTARSRADWKQLLHDFLQQDKNDYTFLPPDRRFSDCDFFFPAFNVDEDHFSTEELWICVDTSASITDEMLSEAMSEILDAMRQTGLKGRLSFFDSTVTEPVSFSCEEEIEKVTPTGGGGTSYHAIFRRLEEFWQNGLPEAILIFTDGYASCPDEEEARGIPVLWLILEGGRSDFPWGRVVEM